MTKGDNLSPRAAVGVELPRNLNAFVNGSEESIRAEASSDDQSANTVGDVHKTFNDFNIWRLFQKNCRVQVSTPEHSPNPFNTQIRRIEDDLAIIAKTLMPSGKTAQNEGLFQSVPRWNGNNSTNGLSRLADSSLSVANDNVMPWHPLDAA